MLKFSEVLKILTLLGVVGYRKIFIGKLSSTVLNSKTVLKIQHRCNDSNPQNAYQLSSYAVHSNVPLDKFYSEPTTTLLCENFNNRVATRTEQKYGNFNNEVTKSTEH